MLNSEREGGARGCGETSMWERNIGLFPPVCTLSGNQIHNVLVHGMMLQQSHPAKALMLSEKIIFGGWRETVLAIYKNRSRNAARVE